MHKSSIEALASTWAQITSEADFPKDYDGTATPAVHQASQHIEVEIRDYIVATGDMRLFSLMHLLGQSALRMEQVLWPEDYARMTLEIEKAMKEADDPNTQPAENKTP